MTAASNSLRSSSTDTLLHQGTKSKQPVRECRSPDLCWRLERWRNLSETAWRVKRGEFVQDAKVEDGHVSSVPSGPAVARAYQAAHSLRWKFLTEALLSILALPFTPHASMGILERRGERFRSVCRLRQVHQICQRFGNWEDIEERTLKGFIEIIYVYIIC